MYKWMIRKLNKEHIEVQDFRISQSFGWSFTQSFLWIGMYNHTINVIIKGVLMFLRITLLEYWEFWYVYSYELTIWAI